MKRIFAIVLLGIHLFYIGGSSLVYQYFIHQSDVQLVKQIYENKINSAKLIQLKIPVNMPSIQDWDDYEEVVGQIQLKDAYYNYVRLKMTRDTMYLICLENTTKTRLVKANVISVKEISDVPVSKKGQTPVTKKVNTVSEYNLQTFNYYFSASYTLMGRHHTILLKQNNPFIESPGKPPNFIS